MADRDSNQRNISEPGVRDNPKCPRWLRSLLVAAICMPAYTVLDRLTVAFGLWPTTYTWHMLAGLTLVLLLGMDTEYAFVAMAASILIGVLSYNLSVGSFWSWVPMAGQFGRSECLRSQSKREVRP